MSHAPGTTFRAQSRGLQRFKSVAVGGCLLTAMLIPAFTSAQQDNFQDPMEDAYSQEIRQAYAECRQKGNPIAQFFCNCRVLEKQCEAPRKLEHGDWNTVEYWPSSDPAKREVQFVLMLSYDIIGDLAPADTGIVVTCMAGVSELHAFVGDDISPEDPFTVHIDNKPVSAAFEEIEDNYLISFQNNRAAYNALRKSDRLTVSFISGEGETSELEFDTFGFDQVSKGWDKLCSKIES